MDRLELRAETQSRRASDRDRAEAASKLRSAPVSRPRASTLACGATGGRNSMPSERQAGSRKGSSRGRRRLHVVRHRQYRHRQSIDDARGSRRNGPDILVQRCGRYRPGVEHDPAADLRRCAGVAGEPVRPADGRYGSDHRCGQDVGVAADIRFREMPSRFAGAELRKRLLAMPALQRMRSSRSSWTIGRGHVSARGSA